MLVVSRLMIFLFMLTFTNMFSQVSKIKMDTYGNFEVTIRVENGTIIIDPKGNIVDINMEGETSYNNFPDKDGVTRIYKIGSTRFHYETVNEERYGKLAKIGDYRIHYSNYPRYEKNKIDKIGDVYFSYGYLNNIVGKLISVGTTGISYNNNYPPEGKNKIKIIGEEYYSYSYQKGNYGKLRDGNRIIFVDGIEFQITDFKINN